MKKIVICDDVEIDRSILRHFLEKYFDDHGKRLLQRNIVQENR